MSSGEEFEVSEILDERKRKGALEYLVRWKGFNDLYDSWEPAKALTDCAQALKTWATKKKKSKSKSRSRSRGRSKSRSRSRSRGRATKSETPSSPKRSRSRSTGRKATRASSRTSVLKVESSPEEVAKTKAVKLQSGSGDGEAKASSSKTEIVVVEEKKLAATDSKEAKVVEQKTEVVKATVETVKMAQQGKSEASGMVTRSRAVRQVENDQKPASKTEESGDDKNVAWLWWFADHAVLVLFIIVSLIALSFTIESIAGVRDKLVPDLSVLRGRLTETYTHFVQGVSAACSNVADAVTHGFQYLQDMVFPAAAQSPPPPPKQSAA